MAEEPPMGAFSEEKRLRMKELYGETEHRFLAKVLPRTHYSVTRKDADLRPSKRFGFVWSPDEAYYFDNYFFAWAYHLKLLRGRGL